MRRASAATASIDEIVPLHRRAAEWTAAVCLALLVAILLGFVLVFYRPFFNSDDAVVNLLAESMWQQGRLLPVGWINNNGDLMMPSGAVIVAPLLRWLPNGYAAHSVASVFAVLLELGSFAWLLRVLDMPRIVILFVTSVLAAGVSFDFTLMVFAQTTYVWWSAGFCAGAALLCGRNANGASPVRDTLLLVLVFAISFANPVRVGLMMVLPLYLLERVLEYERWRSSRRIAAWFGLRDSRVVHLATGFVAAAVLYFGLTRAGITEASYNAASLHWGGIDSVWRHLSTFRGWFDFLGSGTGPQNGNLPRSSLLGGFRMLIACGITAYATHALLHARADDDVRRKALLTALVGAFVPIFLIYSIFDPLAVSTRTLRYFIVPITILFVVTAFGLRDLLQKYPRAGNSGMAIGCLLLLPVAAQRFLPRLPLTPSPSENLVEVLKDNGLRWGYATWWNAGRTTVLSNGFAHVNPVNLGNAGMAPFTNMVLKDWYRPSSWRGQTFLALTDGEATPSRLGMLGALLGTPVRTIDADGYRVFVYGYNIASTFACDDTARANTRLSRDTRLPRISAASLNRLSGSSSLRLRVAIENSSDVTIAPSGRYPMSVGIELLDPDGRVAERDWSHVSLRCAIPPGGTLTMDMALPDVSAAGRRIRIDLVQEGVAWLGDWGGVPVDLALDSPENRTDPSIPMDQEHR
jgi:hypothetical protein